MYIYIIPMVVPLAAAILIKLIVVSSEKAKKKTFIENHQQLLPGMSKMAVIRIMGDSYTQSYLQNGIEKLEWTYRHRGASTRVNRRMYVYPNSYTIRVSVKFKDGKVIEVNSLNMD